MPKLITISDLIPDDDYLTPLEHLALMNEQVDNIHIAQELLKLHNDVVEHDLDLSTIPDGPLQKYFDVIQHWSADKPIRAQHKKKKLKYPTILIGHGDIGCDYQIIQAADDNRAQTLEKSLCDASEMHTWHTDDTSDHGFGNVQYVCDKDYLDYITHVIMQNQSKKITIIAGNQGIADKLNHQLNQYGVKVQNLFPQNALTAEPLIMASIPVLYGDPTAYELLYFFRCLPTVSVKSVFQLDLWIRHNPEQSWVNCDLDFVQNVVAVRQQSPDFDHHRSVLKQWGITVLDDIDIPDLCLAWDYIQMMEIVLKNISVSRSSPANIVIGPLEKLGYMASDRVIFADWQKSNPTDVFLGPHLKSIPETDVKPFYMNAMMADNIMIVHPPESDLHPWLLRLKSYMKDVWETWSVPIEKKMDMKQFLSEKPCPNPPTQYRPTHFTASSLTRLMQNPYHYYMTDVLKLRSLKPLIPEPDAADFGNYVHDVLEKIVKGQDWEPIPVPQSVEYEWSTKIKTIVDRFTEIPQEARKQLCEQKGIIEYGDYTFECRTDRIDIMPDGTVQILDYKTTAEISKSKIESGDYPQLFLNAFIIHHGGFSGVSGSVNQMAYWYVKPFKDIKIQNIDKSLYDAIMVKIFETLEQYKTDPYNYNEFANNYDEIKHFAREGEWRR